MHLSFKKVNLFLIIVAIALVDMASDIYSPGLPRIAEYFNAHYTKVQLTVSLNLIGLAISGLLYGPLSDHYGRRPVMIFGMLLFTISSILCCLVNDLMLLIIIRFIQGLGEGVAAVVGYATIKDMYSGTNCVKALSRLNMVVAFSPAVAPVIGSLIIANGYNWHILFVIVSVVASILFILLFLKFSETITPNYESHLKVKDVFLQYVNVFTNKRFLGFAVIQALTSAWLWSYIANLPFIFTQGMNVSIAYYGYFVTFSVIFYAIGTIINQKIVDKVGSKNILLIGLLLILIADVIVLILFFTINLTAILAEMVWSLSNIGLAFVISNNMNFALDSIKKTGLGSAFIACLQLTFAAIATYITGYFYNGTLIPTSTMTIVCSLLAIAIYMKLKINNK